MLGHAGRLSVGQILAIISVAVIGGVFLPKLVRGGGDAVVADDTPEGAEAPPPRNTGSIDPGPYRTSIQQIEAILYQASPSDLGTGDRISSLTLELGNVVMTREDRVRGVSAGQALLGYSGRIGAESDVGYSTLDLPRARRLWEETRARVFTGAPWFKGSSRDLATQQTRPAPTASPAAIRSLTDVANQLDRLVTLGRSNVAQFPDPYELDPNGPELSRARTRFQQWSVDWTRRLNTVLDLMPALGPNTDGNLYSAFRDLENAARELNEVGRAMNRYGIPTEGARDSRLSTAAAMVTSARQYLDRAS